MMPQNELRIGNWVHTKCKRSPSRIEGINYMSVMVDGHKQIFKNIFPVPLTVGVLEKCGLKLDSYWDKKTYYNDEESFRIQADNDVFIYEMGYTRFNDEGEGIKEFIMVNDMEYLHQFQNIRFALTGEELIYTP